VVNFLTDGMRWALVVTLCVVVLSFGIGGAVYVFGDHSTTCLHAHDVMFDTHNGYTTSICDDRVPADGKYRESP
jgi:hypothetical protein